jgi:hypothetical protein
VSKAIAFEDIDVSQPVNWGEVISDTVKLRVEILSGKHGEINTFAGDGAHGPTHAGPICSAAAKWGIDQGYLGL